MENSEKKPLAGVRVLFVDDEQAILRALQRALSTTHCEVMLAQSGQEGLELLERAPADIIVSDMRMPGMSGEDFLAAVAQHYPDTIRIALTGHAEVASVIAAINLGRIWSYLEKPWDNQQLIIALEQAVQAQKIFAERQLLKRSLEHYQQNHRHAFAGFIGSSVPMQSIYRAIEYAAPSSASVFITGASGTGKEVAAQAIHSLSKRSEEPFIAINCAAIPSELMESEIFGHVKGAFSGAIAHRDGAAAQANGGTLFFDELGEMDINLQAKLLRFIQTGQYQKVGGDKVETADIRFICATNRNPLEAIEANQLREDLYYRLNVVSIHLPTLVEREQDALLLARQFLKNYSQSEDKIFIDLDSEAEDIICRYEWPGNVRQLQNTIYSGVVMSEGPLLKGQALVHCLQLSPAELSALRAKPAVPKVDVQPRLDQPSDITIVPLAELERLYIERAISLYQGNVVSASAALGVSPSTLYRKMQTWQEQH